MIRKEIIMRLFQQPTEILHYNDVTEFKSDFSFSEDDYILASKTIYEHFFKNENLPCTIAFHSDYGKGEPIDKMLDAMLADMRKANPKRIIAIGGGSVIDCAKLFVFDSNANAEDMFLQKCEFKKTRKLIAIPTTCGSGSEVSKISICEITSLNTKLGLAIDELFPDQAILIPQLLSKLPYFYFITSAIDALIHASESLLSPKSNPYTSFFSKDAIQLLIKGFKNLNEYGEDHRFQDLDSFLIASNYAGIAFGNTGTGAVHALSYPLSGKYHVTHGEANYQFFIAVLHKYEELQPQGNILLLKQELAQALSCPIDSVFDELDNLLSALLFKKRLQEYGMKYNEIEEFTQNVLQSQQRLLSNTPITLTETNILSIYKQLF